LHVVALLNTDPNDIDLAIIQLKNKVTPYNVKHFNINHREENIALNDQVYMIGFNYGYELAKTSIEIKSQLTQ
jgi:hypothetical protein